MEIRVGPGIARSVGRQITQHLFEYTEGEHTKSADWDPRETHMNCIVSTLQWDDGTAISDEERERVREGLWRMAKKLGAKALLEELVAFALCLPVRWKRGPNAFLVNVHDANRLDYMMLGRVVVLPYERGAGAHITVRLPERLVWTHPEGVEVPERERDRLARRLSELSDENLWIGSGRGWKVSVA